MAVGSSYPKNVKAEKFDFETGSWTTVNDYPYSDGVAFFRYDMLFIPEMAAYIVIGGEDGDYYDLGTIGMFRNGDWSQAGQLNTARSVNFKYFFCFEIIFLKAHRALWSNDGLIVSGGYFTISSEKCTMENNVFTCVDISPSLLNYVDCVSFIVPAKYCV